MKYREIRKGETYPGDILKLKDTVWDETIGAGSWNGNFKNEIRYYKVEKITNAGNAWINNGRKRKLVNVYTDREVLAAYTAV